MRRHVLDNAASKDAMLLDAQERESVLCGGGCWLKGEWKKDNPVPVSSTDGCMHKRLVHGMPPGVCIHLHKEKLLWIGTLPIAGPHLMSVYG